MKNRFVSGEWSGFYIEKHRAGRGWMHLYLTFDGGKITGEGTDYVGPWVATGSYDEQTGHCNWTKQYVGKHQVAYRGTYSGNGIQGTWKIISEGPFHIWPRNEGHFNELYLRDELDSSSGAGHSLLLEGGTHSTEPFMV